MPCYETTFSKLLTLYFIYILTHYNDWTEYEWKSKLVLKTTLKVRCGSRVLYSTICDKPPKKKNSPTVTPPHRQTENLWKALCAKKWRHNRSSVMHFGLLSAGHERLSFFNVAGTNLRAGLSYRCVYDREMWEHRDSRIVQRDCCKGFAENHVHS